MNSLVPDSVLEVSNVTISRALTDSLGANSYLQNQKVRVELERSVDRSYVPIHRRPCFGLDQFQGRTFRGGERHVVSCATGERVREYASQVK